MGQGQDIFREKQPSVPCVEVPGHPPFSSTRPLSCLTLSRCLCPASWKWHRRKIQLSCVLDAPIEITPSPDTWGAQTKRGTLGPTTGIEASNSLCRRSGAERLCYLSWEWVHVLSRGAESQDPFRSQERGAQGEKLKAQALQAGNWGSILIPPYSTRSN